MVSGRHAVYLWPQSLSAGVTVSFGIILPLHTSSFQPMPASTPASVKQNSYNTMTGHSNRCGVTEITQTGGEGLFVTLVHGIKNGVFFTVYTLTHTCTMTLNAVAVVHVPL